MKTLMYRSSSTASRSLRAAQSISIDPPAAVAGMAPVASPLDDARMVRCFEAKIECLPGLPYETWNEVVVPLGLTESQTLTASEERVLFQQMNLSFHQALQCRAELETSLQPEPLVAEFERLVCRAERIRDALFHAFYKLNLSIAGRFTNSLHTFDELVSEGQYTLLRAIARFDPERGFRFSTYAMHAIRRRLLRFIRQRQRQRQLAQAWSEDDVPTDTTRWTRTYERRITLAVSALEQLLPHISPRERYVIRARFGWGQEFEPRTLKEIAEELGVSRERVRQLEARALRKLRSLADDLDIELCP